MNPMMYRTHKPIVRLVPEKKIKFLKKKLEVWKKLRVWKKDWKFVWVEKFLMWYDVMKS